jgi:hypothetical protein
LEKKISDLIYTRRNRYGRSDRKNIYAAWSDKNQHEGANYNRIKSRFYLMRFWKKKKESNKLLQPR